MDMTQFNADLLVDCLKPAGEALGIDHNRNYPRGHYDGFTQADYNPPPDAKDAAIYCLGCTMAKALETYLQTLEN